MIINGETLRTLLNNLNIKMQLHNNIVTFMDLVDNKILYPHEYQYDKAPFNGNRRPIEPACFEDIFNGTDIDLLQNNQPYKRYMFNIENKSNNMEEKYSLNSFESFEILPDNRYVRTTMKFDKNGIRAYETIGELDQFSNFKTSNIHKLFAKEEAEKGFIEVKDETDPRLENNEFDLYFTKYVNDKFYVTKTVEDIENGYQIIEDSKYFKNTLEILYPSMFEAYQNELDNNMGMAK